MKTYRFVIKPCSAFGSPLSGDMLFGQLCWALRNRHGEAHLNSLLQDYTKGKPFAVISDAFPANHLPRPHLHWFKLESNDRKAAKKRVWLPIAHFAEPVSDWLKHCQASSDVSGGAPESFSQPHNTINRLTGTTGANTSGDFAPYAMEQLWFKSAKTEILLDITVVFDETRIEIETLHTALNDIGRIGFGRDASIGLGKFNVVNCEDHPLPNQPDANAWLSLAPCAPQGCGFDPQRSFYKTSTRFGRHGDIGVKYGNPFKSPVLLAQTGAVFTPRVVSAEQTLFVGQGLGGNASLSKTIKETVHQGYAPVVGIRIAGETA